MMQNRIFLNACNFIQFPILFTVSVKSFVGTVVHFNLKKQHGLALWQLKGKTVSMKVLNDTDIGIRTKIKLELLKNIMFQ